MGLSKAELLALGLGSVGQINELATQVDAADAAVTTAFGTADAVVTGYFTPSIQSAVAAAGTTIADATQTTGDIVHVGTVASNTGVLLRAATTYKKEQIIINRGANALKVYPPTAASWIGGLSAGTAISLSATQRMRFIAVANNEYEPFGY